MGNEIFDQGYNPPLNFSGISAYSIEQLPSPNPIINRASFIYNYSLGTIVNIASALSSQAITTIVKAIVNVNKQVNKTYGGIGSTINYTIIISNSGNTNARNIYLIDTLPNGTNLVSGTFKQDGTLVGGTPQGAELPNQVLPGGVSTVTFQVLVYTIPIPNPVVNNASLNYRFIINPITNTSIAKGITSNAVATTINYSIVSTSKNVDTEYAQLGDTLTYSVIITNTGTSDVGNILLIDTIPSSTTYVTNSFTVNGIVLPGQNPAVPGAYVPTIPANRTSTITFQVIITTLPTSNPLKNSASVSYKYTVYPTLPFGEGGNGNTGIATTTVIDALVNVFKTVNPDYARVGDTITYTIKLSNLGNTQTNTIYFFDTIPSGTTFVSGSLYQDTTQILGSTEGVYLPNQLLAFGTSTITFKVIVNTIPTPNPILNQASVEYSFTTNPITQSTISRVGISSQTSTKINDTKLTAIKSVDKPEAQIGDTITYTVVLTNIGSVSANVIRFIDTVPNGVTFISNSFTINGVMQSGVNPNPPGVSIPTIPANSISTVTFQAIVTTVPTINPINNSAYIGYAFTLYPTIANGVIGNFTTNNAVTTIINPIFKVFKYADQEYATCGDTITYTLKVINEGNVNAFNISLFDTIPSGLIFVPNSVNVNGVNEPGENPSNGINITSLSVGEVLTIDFKVNVVC